MDGVDLVIGTSSFLKEHSHGKDMVAIEKAAIEVVNYVKRWALPGYLSTCGLFLANMFEAAASRFGFLRRTASGYVNQASLNTQSSTHSQTISSQPAIPSALPFGRPKQIDVPLRVRVGLFFSFANVII